MENNENLLEESFKLTDPDTGEEFEKNVEAMNKYFNIFNEKYFHGDLKPISFSWFKGTRVHGYFRSKPGNVILKKIEPVEIKLNINACGTFAAFRNTFVHEMLHYYRDCVVGFTDEEWEAARFALSYHDILRYRRILNHTDETCHTGVWKRLADKLSAEYPELGNIERYAVHNAETGVAQMDKKYLVDFCLKNVILKKESGIRENQIYCVSKNNPTLIKLLKAIEAGQSAREAGLPSYLIGKWTRMWPTLKPEEFKNMSVSRDFNRYYSEHQIPKQMFRKEEPLGDLKSM